jgi:hypothetical protein
MVYVAHEIRGILRKANGPKWQIGNSATFRAAKN